MRRPSRIDFTTGKRLITLAMLSVSAICMLAPRAAAADLHLPAIVDAGQGFSISLEGAGSATFYLLGPDYVAKRNVNLGSEIQVQGNEVRTAGRYQVILCTSTCTSSAFEVKAAAAEHLSFFLHPSRVPVSTPGSIDATAFVFDQYFNLVLTPATVDFRITPANGTGFSRPIPTRNGVAWMRMDSSPHEGRVGVTAALGNVEEARVIQQVAAEACNLRMKVATNGSLVTLETDPVRDCSGNALPDGTVVSFTKTDREGKTTVDSPIKKGVARTQFQIHGPAQIGAACGVVVGNEIALNGKL